MNPRFNTVLIMSHYLTGSIIEIQIDRLVVCLSVCFSGCLKEAGDTAKLDPRAAELAAGRRPETNCGLAAGKIAASRQPGRKKYAAKPQPKIRLTAAFPRDVKKISNYRSEFVQSMLSYSSAPRSARGRR